MSTTTQAGEALGALPRQRSRPVPPRRSPRSAPQLCVRRASLLADVLALLAAVALLGGAGAADDMVVFGLVLLAGLGAAGLHRARLNLSVLDELPVVLVAALAAAGTTAATAAVLRYPPLDAVVVARLGGAVLLVLAARALVYAVVAAARRSRRVAHRTVVVGCGGLGGQLADVLGRGTHGLLPVGFVDDDPQLAAGERPLPVLGGLRDLPSVVRATGADTVVLGFSNAPERVVVDVVRACHRLDVEIFTVPRYWQVHSTHRLVEVVHGIPLVRLRRPAFRSSTWRLKRVVDVVGAAAGLALLWPLVAVCALAVRREGGPGVLFRQVRVGLDGREFELLKLRSLRPVDAAESATTWSIADDDRVGPVGRLMRRTSLDELPQLWNVLRGDMSLVGPRPERPHFVQRFTAEHEDYLWRHRVPCGLTGWAQINGLRGDTSIGERARFDNFYVENWSLWLDLLVLLRTTAHVVSGTGR
ncbi:exopolysaccharide biosynthesis polyprenyl glycosylphosphotransferase [Pseudokineococcus basanitobsidens]|uniref:Exopolysaccharide biosynthesis polyprenyl glycosylphosphotransferase n=1 Tax=Pseudokineococcus basanitobsidens TaxID=1926649 RepID=A0ABU8RI01_9ACTN